MRRDRKSIVAGNNLSYTAVALLFMSDHGAIIFFGSIIGVVLFFPLSADPLRKIPAERLALWPLTSRERRMVRLLSIWLNPVSWALAALLLWTRVTLGLWMLIAALFAFGFAAPWRYFPHFEITHHRLPAFPTRLNQLLRKNLREMLATLDFYAALVLMLPAAAFRAAGRLPQDALLPLTIVVMLMISTCGLSQFGLDGEGAFTRYRLLPLSGWQILAAKDAVFLLVSLVLTMTLNPAAGLAAAFLILAVGHASSVRRYGDERRWRFGTSHSFALSAAQIVLMIMAAAAVQWRSLALLLCAALYLISTWRYGHILEHQLAEPV